MLFRPEEVHPRSEKRRPASRGAEPIVEVTDHPRWVDPDDTTIAHFDRDRVAAVQAWGVDADRLAGEQPGDRGRLEAALSEPPLGTAHGDPVLRRQVVERRERRDVVRVGMEPADRVGLHHVMEESAPLFDRKPKRAGEIGIVRRAPGLYEPAHDALKHPVHEERVSHRYLRPSASIQPTTARNFSRQSGQKSGTHTVLLWRQGLRNHMGTSAVWLAGV